MLEVRIFRFNAANDVLSYHKPYFFDKFSFDALENLLQNVKTQDPYFDFDGAKFVKINGVVVPLESKFGDILERFGYELEILPLSAKRATKDLIINNDDFLAKFSLFEKICNKDDFESYKNLQSYFYAGFMNEFEPKFVGASAIIFAKILCEKYPQKQSEILEILDDAKFGVWIAPSLKNDLFWSDEIYQEALEFVRSNLKAPKQNLPELKESQNEPLDEIKRDFTGFIIATYGEIRSELLNLNAEFINFKSQNLPCGFELLNLNDELAHKLAAAILFDAFDSGADFLLVSDEKAFYMFDAMSQKLIKSAGRGLEKFYILRQNEFAALANGKIPTALKEHRLKVGLC